MSDEIRIIAVGAVYGGIVALKVPSKRTLVLTYYHRNTDEENHRVLLPSLARAPISIFGDSFFSRSLPFLKPSRHRRVIATAAEQSPTVDVFDAARLSTRYTAQSVPKEKNASHAHVSSQPLDCRSVCAAGSRSIRSMPGVGAEVHI
jgi:hypothetical protein